MSSNNKKKGIIVFIIVVVLVIVSAAIQIIENRSDGNFTISPEDNFYDDSSIASNTGSSMIKKGNSKNHKDYIAELVISGTIQTDGKTYNQKWLLNTIQKLSNDKHNMGIILYIDSPGGTVYEADEAYLALVNYVNKGKPVYAYFGSLAASGGYYIACASSYIMANRNTLTGSIGVISGNFIDLTGLFEKYGIKYTTITAGRNKNMGNCNEPMSEEQKNIMQSIADECYEQFTRIVASSRNMDKEEVYTLADGRIYTAKQALNNGLIDGIGNFDSLVYQMEVSEFSGEEYKIVKYEYVPKETIYSRLMGMTQSLSRLNSSASLPSVIEKALESEVPFPSYYYNNSGRF